jgi:hypothetical protein
MKLVRGCCGLPEANLFMEGGHFLSQALELTGLSTDARDPTVPRQLSQKA